jgi:hypothetical protein
VTDVTDKLAATEGIEWGYFENGVFITVPKVPLLNANLEPPCDVTVRGSIRHIIVKPPRASIMRGKVQAEIDDLYAHLAGLTALVRVDPADPSCLLAQFDDKALIEAYGWHKLPASIFDITGEVISAPDSP